MKNILLTLAILFIVIIVQAQTDIIYPAEGGNIIFDCKINEVKNGNNVHFTKDSISATVKAVAITKDGRYIDLEVYVNKMNRDNISTNNSTQLDFYRGQNHDYYKKLYKESKSDVRFGCYMTILGLGGTIGGIVMSRDDKEANDKAGTIITIAGVILFNIGIPYWISGAVKAANNKKAMEMTKRNTNLSFSTTNNGVGLVFNF